MNGYLFPCFEESNLSSRLFVAAFGKRLWDSQSFISLHGTLYSALVLKGLNIAVAEMQFSWSRVISKHSQPHDFLCLKHILVFFEASRKIIILWEALADPKEYSLDPISKSVCNTVQKIDGVIECSKYIKLEMPPPIKLNRTWCSYVPDKQQVPSPVVEVIHSSLFDPSHGDILYFWPENILNFAKICRIRAQNCKQENCPSRSKGFLKYVVWYLHLTRMFNTFAEHHFLCNRKFPNRDK